MDDLEKLALSAQDTTTPTRPTRKAVRRGGSWLPLLALASIVGAPSPLRAASTGPEARRRIGELWVSDEGRRRVRGGHAEDSTIHDGWVSAPRHLDLQARADLAAFERASFPDPSGVVPSAPKPWMEDLTKPDLPVRWTRRLVEYLTYFKDNDKGRALMRGWLRRARRYESTLRKILTESGVPEDLVFVALAESGFNPTVRSPVGAAGLWQFMEATGQVYGLDTDYWVDDRHDIVKSTRAAALYLADLKARFGTWELALAAYNAGYGLVMVSIRRHNTNDFWALCDIESGLPYATTNYVPKIFAASLVGRNREAFGFADADIDPVPAVDWIEVKVPAKTALDRLAKKIDVDDHLLAELNAQYIRGRTPPRGTSPVRIPRAAKDAFEAAYPELVNDALALQTYTFRHGDELAAVAERFGTTDKALRRFNGVEDSAELTGGVEIVLPPPDAAAEPTAETTKIASAEPKLPELAAVPALTVAKGKRRVFFVVNRASMPRQLAAAFSVPWASILRWNELDATARLQSGQVLQVLVDAAFDPAPRNLAVLEEDEVTLVVRGSREHVEQSLLRRGLVRRGYKVKKGEDLAKIARRFDLTVGDLARINGFAREHAPTTGEIVVVYIPEKQAGGTVRAPDPPGPPTRAPTTPGTADVPRDKPAPRGPSAPTRAPSTAGTASVPGAR